MAHRVCLVTVHGIGFQQPPQGGHPGYADGLHDLLAHQLGEMLCQDPDQTGRGYGPVYVQSSWQGSPDAGRKRLDGPLGEAPVAHVALVYSDLEEMLPHPGAMAETATRAALSLGHYTSIIGAMRLILADIWANLRPRDQEARSTGLIPRTGIPRAHHPLGEEAMSPAIHSGPSGLISTLIALEDDVASYVTRNDLRERVRGFVQEALVRLTARDDIERIVVNAHSQGTVICFDVLARLPGDICERKLAKFITAGSPIRKYVDLFSWGGLVGSLAPLAEKKGWLNFWDGHDPVADPLDPPAGWRPGDPLDRRSPGELGLLISRARDGVHTHCFVEDRRVDNLCKPTSGGLPAHDYWSNETEFINPFAELLRLLAG
jgi:hypothetical protein